MRKKFSCLLIAWVGLACPILCGIRAEASGPALPAGSCCEHGHTGPDEKAPPSCPREEGPDRCFCSAHGVLAEKSESLQAAYLVQPLECDAVPVLQSGVSQPLPDVPQFALEAYRVLPLLI